MEKKKLLHRVKYLFKGLLVAVTLVTQGSNAVSNQEVVDQVRAKTIGEVPLHQEIVKTNQERSLKYQNEAQKTVKQAEIGFKQHSEKLEAEEGSLLEQIIQNSKNLSTQDKANKAQGLIVFVSFSMPKELLLQYKKQVELYGGRIVIRGLVENDFKKTISAMDLGNDQKLIVDIDPQLFKEHKIEAVPAIVLVSANKSDKFSGSASVSYALEEAALRGEMSDFALRALNKIKEEKKKI